MTKRRDREPEGGAWSPFKSREEAAMALYALLERCGLLDILRPERRRAEHERAAARRRTKTGVRRELFGG